MGEFRGTIFVAAAPKLGDFIVGQARRARGVQPRRGGAGVAPPAAATTVQRVEGGDAERDDDSEREALNALSLVPQPDDFPLLLEHVETAPPEIYGQTRPLTAVAQIARIVGVSKIRGSLYMARDNAEDLEIKSRYTELIEYLRYDH